MLPTDLKKLYVRNAAGQNGAVLFLCHRRLLDFRLPQAGALQRIPCHQHPGRGGAWKEFRRSHASHGRVHARLPRGFGYDWTGLSYQERMAGGQTVPLYAFSILVIFLCLAALYESWPIPISILMTLPLGAIGGVVASSLRGLPNDVYFQIGLFDHPGADHQERHPDRPVRQGPVDEGVGLVEATLEAPN
jgi:HAE1 family hydrophobic/amphiphilic exporter-1